MYQPKQPLRIIAAIAWPLLLALVPFWLSLPVIAQPADMEVAGAAAAASQLGESFPGMPGTGGAVLIPVLAIILIFGMPPLTIILLALFIFRHRERRQRLYNERLQRFLEAGQPIPEELLRSEVSQPAPQQHLNRGLALIGLGLGLGVFLGLVAGWKVGSIALIPLALGAAQLISWKNPEPYCALRLVEGYLPGPMALERATNAFRSASSIC